MITKIMAFAMSIASRGFKNSKINLDIKKLRYISCYGFEEIEKCSNLKKSEKSEFYYCNGCGCGDHPHTWLIREENEYSKLDYPYLDCPYKMPGFSNYDPNSPKEDLKRKKDIEKLDPQKFKFIDLSLSVNEEKQKIFESLMNIVEDHK